MREPYDGVSKEVRDKDGNYVVYPRGSRSRRGGGERERKDGRKREGKKTKKKGRERKKEKERQSKLVCGFQNDPNKIFFENAQRWDRRWGLGLWEKPLRNG